MSVQSLRMEMGELKYNNIVSVSWGDHLVFGEGDGRLVAPAAVRRRMQHWKKELAAGDFDGLFVCLRSRSRPAEFADQFGFNQPIREEFFKAPRPGYPDGANPPPLETGLTAFYQPVIDQQDTKLYLARQRQPRSPAKKKACSPTRPWRD